MAKIVNGTGIAVSTRAKIWGSGYVIAPGGLRTAAKPEQPWDEAKTFRFPMNNPGSTIG